jgi:hypothetical protein
LGQPGQSHCSDQVVIAFGARVTEVSADQRGRDEQTVS